jgi:hypothetical protein
MGARTGSSSFWIGILVPAGAALALALLVQTVVNYRYVSQSLIEQAGRRAAADRVRSVERAVRLTRPQDAAAFQVLLDDLRVEMTDQIAAIALLRIDGTLVASSADPGVAAAFPGEGPVGPARRGDALRRESFGGREVLIGVFACQCRLPREAAGTAAERLLVGVALYRDSLSTPYARLRRNALVSTAAALALLVTLAVIAARFGRYVRGKQLEAQMVLARQVQRDLLPDVRPLPAGVEAAAEFVPASQVGGDFYDIVALPGGRIAFVLGDVSGHGIAAALLMSLIHGAMSSPPWGTPGNEAGSAAGRLNDLLVAKSSGERFASLFWCAYDPAARELQYLNAGHPPACLIRRPPGGAPVVERLADGGPVLGVLPAPTYHTVSVEAGAGDLLVVYSDGLAEAFDSREQYFGEERLVAIAQQHLDRPARTIAAEIVAELRRFTGGAPVQDDQTLLVVRFN